MKNRIKCIGIVFLIYLAYVIACLVVPPLFHRTAVPGETAGFHGTDVAAQERVLCIDSNEDALVWRLRLIEAAQEKIVLTTFDWRDDQSGQDIMAALLNAANRGVQVQLLVDGLNADLHLIYSDDFRTLASHECVEVKLYNPINLAAPWTVNYRMHDKYLIADDFAYILGGRNTDDLFLGSYADDYNEDKDILVYETVPGAGGSYVQLTEYFEQIWNLSCCVPYEKPGGSGEYLQVHYQQLVEQYPQVISQPDWESVTMETNGIELCTNPIEPENKQPLLWERLAAEMRQGGDVLIFTPYIICNEKMYRDLTEISRDASKVEIIINAVESGTNPFGCTDYVNQKDNVQQTGAYVCEYLGEQALHTKTILIGSDITIVGSFNMDMRSVYLDTEMMLIIDSPELNAAVRGQAEEYRAKSRIVSPDGAEENGKAYQPAEQDTGKEIVYGILRVLTLPFRHLL